ncbi:hypothetical protein Q9966_016413 [Columba livia]|nr:hypothetical protein Q9966_016413 [Columba livia]
MLEFALKQERSKYHKLKFGADAEKKAEPGTRGGRRRRGGAAGGPFPPPEDEDSDEDEDAESPPGLHRKERVKVPPSPPLDDDDDDDDSEDALGEFHFLGAGGRRGPPQTPRARGAVLAVAVAGDGGTCVSGGVDGDIRRWRLPDLDLDLDPYDGYGTSPWPWGHPCHPRVPQSTVSPTSVTFSATQPCHLVVAFRTGVTALYDVTVARPLLLLDTRGGAINQVVCHPGQPVVVTAGDDRAIRFLDTRAGHVVHSMVAHLDAVTCLAIDPSGGFLMSGSHDCSLRLWHWGHRACVQELPAHRRRHDEGVLGVTFHPQRPLGASAGADGLAKVFV